MTEEKYKLPWHIKQFVKQELMDYQENDRLAKTAKTDTQSRELLLVGRRLDAIDRVLDSLDSQELEAAEIIFFKKYSQAKAEAEHGISKRAYYYTMNKVFYLVAKEMRLI